MAANTCGRLGGQVLMNNRSRRESSPITGGDSTNGGDFNSHRNHIPYEILAEIRHRHQKLWEQDDPNDDDDDRRNNRKEKSPRRGNHVINNVLNVYRDNVRSFV